jgi:hypothetical protein
VPQKSLLDPVVPLLVALSGTLVHSLSVQLEAVP